MIRKNLLKFCIIFIHPVHSVWSQWRALMHPQNHPTPSKWAPKIFNIYTDQKGPITYDGGRINLHIGVEWKSLNENFWYYPLYDGGRINLHMGLEWKSLNDSFWYHPLYNGGRINLHIGVEWKPLNKSFWFHPLFVSQFDQYRKLWALSGQYVCILKIFGALTFWNF